jgi:hypothetical protein
MWKIKFHPHTNKKQNVLYILTFTFIQSKWEDILDSNHKLVLEFIFVSYRPNIG